MKKVWKLDWAVIDLECAPVCVKSSDSAVLMCLKLLAFGSNRKRANVSGQKLNTIFAYRPTKGFLKKVRNFIGYVVYRHLDEDAYLDAAIHTHR